MKIIDAMYKSASKKIRNTILKQNETKILFVDDEKDIVEFLQYNLNQEGFEVITAYNGMEALQKLV